MPPALVVHTLPSRPYIHPHGSRASTSWSWPGSRRQRCIPAFLGFAGAALWLALLTGCATTGPTGTDVLTGAIPAKSARLVIYRSSAVGLAIQPDYVIDGKAVAGSQPNGFVLCHLRAGRHEVAVANMPLSNNFFGEGAESLTLNLRAGTAKYLAASPQMGIFTPGKITLKEVSEAQGRADTASFHQINTVCG